MFYRKGEEAGTRKVLLDYVWEEQITPQLGYSFSRNHTIPYSIIALQEVHLYHKYPSLYWNTACLTVNAQSMEADELEGVETTAKSTDYRKMATAIETCKATALKFHYQILINQILVLKLIWKETEFIWTEGNYQNWG